MAAKKEENKLTALQVEALCTKTSMHWRRVSPDEFEADGTRGCLMLNVRESYNGAGDCVLTVALSLLRYPGADQAFVGTTRVPLEDAAVLPSALAKAIDTLAKTSKDIIKAARR